MENEKIFHYYNICYFVENKYYILSGYSTYQQAKASLKPKQIIITGKKIKLLENIKVNKNYVYDIPIEKNDFKPYSEINYISPYSLTKIQNENYYIFKGFESFFKSKKYLEENPDCKFVLTFKKSSIDKQIEESPNTVYIHNDYNLTFENIDFDFSIDDFE